jgi:pSer/pThr/pTyr-binding forkhead associated (FHA) protein
MMLAVIILIIRYLIVVCLFAFLGWVIFTLWRELKFQSQMVASKKIPVITLHLENGQEITHHDYDKPEVIIGRDDDCDLRLNEEVVSSHHARLFFRSSQWWVEDLQSTNGTYLNDERVEIATVIIKGDELRIGNQIISIEIQNA